MQFFTLLWDSYIARLFIKAADGWFFAPYRSGELLQKVTDEQRDALLALYRKLFVSHLALEGLVVVLLVLSIPTVALSFSDGIGPDEAGTARDFAIGTAAVFFGWVIATTTYQVMQTKRILGHRDFLPPRDDRHEIGLKLAAQYVAVWEPFQNATRMAMFAAVAVLVTAMMLALVGTTQGEAARGHLYLYTAAQLAAVYVLFKYHRHRRQMKMSA